MNDIKQKILSNVVIENIKKLDNLYVNFGYSSSLIPASDKEIEMFIEWWRKEMISMEIPYQYLEFLKISNHFFVGDLNIYTIRINDENSIYEMNEVWTYNDEDMKEYVFFGSESISWFVQSKSTKKYLVLDKPSADIIKEFDTFEDLLVEAIGTLLNE